MQMPDFRLQAENWQVMQPSGLPRLVFASLALRRMDVHMDPMGGKSLLCSAQSTQESPMGQFPFVAQLNVSPSSCCFPILY